MDRIPLPPRPLSTLLRRRLLERARERPALPLPPPVQAIIVRTASMPDAGRRAA